MKTTIKNINLSLKGFLTISDAYTLPTVTGGLGDIMMSDGAGGVSWQPASALALTTDDITEATNLYYTDERVDDRVSSLIQNGIGINWSYDDPSNTLTGNVTLAPFSTDDLSEGSNLYYTDERVDDRVSVLIQDNTGISWTYLDGTGTLTPTINISDFTTDDLPQGTTNLYFTNEAIDDRVSALIQNGTGINWTYNDPLNTLTGNVTLAPFSTDDLSEGSNLYYTDERVDDRISDLIQDSATITWSYNDVLNTLTANAVTTNLVNISKNGSSIGSQPEINFIEGSDISLSVINDGANNRINVTVSGTAVTGQPGTVTTIANDGVQIGDSDITSIEFSSKFNVVEILDTFVQVDIDMSLEELNNVSNASPLLDWDVLKYNSSLGIWENGNLSEVLSLDQLSDVELTSPQEGDGIIYNSVTGQWENSHIAQSLSELDDISISSPAQSGDILMYNASLGIWENIEGVLSSLLDVSSATPTDLQALKYNSLSGLWQPYDSLYKVEQDSATVKDHFNTLNFKGAFSVSTGFTPEIIDVSLDTSVLSISDFGDVNLVSPILDGDSLIYNATLGVWEAGSPNVGITQIQVDGVVQNTSTPTLNFISSDFNIIESPADIFELSINDSGINHDSTFGFVANEHVDHSTVFLIAGDGLSGGGDLTSSRTLNLDIPGLDPLSDGSLASNDTLVAYNTSAAAHEEVTIAQLSSAVGESLGINPINGIIYTSSSWTDNVDGTITLPTVDAVLYDDQNWNGTAARFTVTGGTTGTGLTALTDEATNYIYIDYNSGSPQWVVTTSEPDYNRSDRAKYVTLYRAGNFLHVLDWGFEGSGLSNKLLQRLYETNKFQRASGLAISTGGNDDLQVNIDAGDVWNGVHREITPSINSWDDTFFSSYHTAGAWDRTVTGLGAGIANNTHYDNGTDLVALGSGKYVVNWYYKGVESGSHVYEVIGRGEYNSVAAAQLESIPPVPELVSSHAILVGRIICQEGSSTPVAVESAFEDQFTATEVTAHNDLSGIQGGTGGEYFHLTNAQHTYLTTNTFLEGTPFYLYGTTADAGSNKTANIERSGGILLKGYSTLGFDRESDNITETGSVNSHSFNLTGNEDSSGSNAYGFLNTYSPYNLASLIRFVTVHGTKASPLAAISGRKLAEIQVRTFDGTNYIDVIQEQVKAEENFTTLTRGVSKVFKKINLGESALSDILEFTAAGNIRFNDAYQFPKVDGTAGQVPTTDGAGNVTWQTPASGVGGSGTTSYVARWTPDGSTLGDSLIQDDGTTLGINVSPDANNTLRISSSLRFTQYNINSYSGGSSASALQLSTQGINSGTNNGIVAVATGSTLENVGGVFIANGTNPYSVRLSDGTQGIGKFLKSVTSDGKANWADITESDIIDLGTYAKVGTYTDSYVPRWNSTTNTLESSLIRDDGTTIGINNAPIVNAQVYVKSTAQLYGLASENTSNSGVGVYGQSSGSTGTLYGVYGISNGTGITNIGIGARALNGTNNYALKLEDGTEGTGKFLKSVTSDGKANWANITASDISGAVGGSGATNQVAYFTASDTISSDSDFLFNGSTISIGGALNTNYKLNVESSSGTIGIRSNVTNNGSSAFFGVSSGVGSSTNVAVNGTAQGSTVSNIGVRGDALGASAENIGGYFRANGATANYSLQLIDGSQGAGKVLTSDALGRATWQTPSGGGTPFYLWGTTTDAGSDKTSSIYRTGTIVASNTTSSPPSRYTSISSGGVIVYSDTYAQITQQSYSDSNFPLTRMTRFRASGSGALNNYVLGWNVWNGGAGDSALIQAKATEDHTSGNIGTQLLFQTAKNGSGALEDRLEFTSDGYVKLSGAYKMPNVDGTIGQVPTTDGSGNVTWTDITESDITDLGTYALVGSYTNNYVTKWNATTNTLEESLIRDDGNNVAIGAAPNATRALYVQTSSDIYAIAGQNASTSGIVVGTQGVSVNPSSTEVSYGVAGSAGSGSITKPSTLGAGDLVGISGSAFDSSTAGKLIGALGNVQSSSTASGDAYGVYSFVNASTAINAYAIGIHLNSNANPTHNLGIIEEANTGFYSDTDFVMIDAGGVFNFSNINNLTADSTPDPSADYVMTWDDSASAHKKVLVSDLIPYDMSFACGDESTAITVANDLVTLRAARAFTLTNVKASLTTAGSTSGVTTIDVKVNGVSIFSTLLTIDAGETTSVTAATPAVLSTTSIADDAEITVDVTTVSGGGTEAGLKVYLIGNLA